MSLHHTKLLSLKKKNLLLKNGRLSALICKEYILLVIIKIKKNMGRQSNSCTTVEQISEDGQKDRKTDRQTDEP